MPKFIIERDPKSRQLRRVLRASAKSCCALRELGPAIQWIHSYVTDDKRIASTSRRMKP